MSSEVVIPNQDKGVVRVIFGFVRCAKYLVPCYGQVRRWNREQQDFVQSSLLRNMLHNIEQERVASGEEN